MGIEKLIEFVTEYCRIDYDMDGYEYDDIKNYVYASMEYIRSATGIEILDVFDGKDFNSLYKLAVAMLCSHWYENRAITTTENNTSLKHSLSYILMQLKYCYGEK